jgi:lipopolysaccharide/colanic/teichoic acid biosynthesis glycosyltransferase
MAKRLIDLLLAAAILVAASPLLALAMLAVVAHDGGPALYWGVRVGRGGKDFRMAKLRTMAVDSELRGGASTAHSDARITAPGACLRRWKLDELPQLWNVLTGEMSLVGPRPNTRRGGVDRYTAEEFRLLSVRPGITDLSSIVFADEADILEGAEDPDARYDRLIRPWKSRLGLLYVERRTLDADLRILWLTALALAARPLALQGVEAILAGWAAPEALREVCRRRSPLPWAPPPGADAPELAA